MATAFGGTTFPPCAANDFSCALRGTLAWTVEPGETATPANVNEPAIAETDAASSSTINPTSENSRAQVPQTYWEDDRIMLFRTLEQKTCGTERSTLI
jgi:hypothetical protein